MSYHQNKSSRSFFWPVILLGAGVIWLLTNLGIIPTENLWILFQLWPVLIIMIGLDVIFSRSLPGLGALLALLLIGGVVYILLMGGDLALAEKPEAQTETFTVAAEETNTASFALNLTTHPAFVNALEGSNNLIDARIGHFGNVELTVTGGEEKQITLEQTGVVGWLTWLLPEAEQELIWDVRLNPEVPFDLDVDGSTGEAELDLSEISLENFRFNASTGASTIIFPASSAGYEARIDGSTGSIDILLPAEGNLTLQLNGSTGHIRLNVPEGAALQVEVLRGGTGDVVRPDWLMKVEGREDRDEGLYQTGGFESAEYQLVVIMEDLSMGDLVIE
ncbi:MAG: LiaI-LiaF-like domain-containing protein [Brevefilum sp.]